MCLHLHPFRYLLKNLVHMAAIPFEKMGLWARDIILTLKEITTTPTFVFGVGVCASTLFAAIVQSMFPVVGALGRAMETSGGRGLLSQFQLQQGEQGEPEHPGEQLEEYQPPPEYQPQQEQPEDLAEYRAYVESLPPAEPQYESEIGVPSAATMSDLTMSPGTEDYFYDNDYYYTDDEYSPNTVLGDEENMDGVLAWYMRGRSRNVPEEPLGPLGTPLDPDFDF